MIQREFPYAMVGELKSNAPDNVVNVQLPAVAVGDTPTVGKFAATPVPVPAITQFEFAYIIE
jgi:hypothetical protein